MSRRSSTGWLIGALVVITALGFATFLLPLRTCGSCDALGRTLQRRYALPAPQLNCPDCGDLGNISLFRSWMPLAVSEQVGRIVRGLHEETDRNSYDALIALLRMDGKDPDTFLRKIGPYHGVYLKAKFMEAENRKYLILLLDYRAMVSHATSGTGVLLLLPEGNALDCVHMTCSNRDAHLYSEIVADVAQDQAQVRVNVASDITGVELPPKIDYDLYLSRDSKHHGTIDLNATTSSQEVSRMRIREGRLEILTPIIK